MIRYNTNIVYNFKCDCGHSFSILDFQYKDKVECPKCKRKDYIGYETNTINNKHVYSGLQYDTPKSIY